MVGLYQSNDINDIRLVLVTIDRRVFANLSNGDKRLIASGSHSVNVMT